MSVSGQKAKTRLSDGERKHKKKNSVTRTRGERGIRHNCYHCGYTTTSDEERQAFAGWEYLGGETGWRGNVLWRRERYPRITRSLFTVEYILSPLPTYGRHGDRVTPVGTPPPSAQIRTRRLVRPDRGIFHYDNAYRWAVLFTRTKQSFFFFN